MPEVAGSSSGQRKNRLWYEEVLRDSTDEVIEEVSDSELSDMP